jgi:TPR repeat protein
MRAQLHRFVAGVLAASALLQPALAAPEIVVLGTGTGGDPVAACGDLAASPFESGREGRGLTDAQIFISGAISACEAALVASPQSVEARTWLARAYFLSGRTAEARTLLEEASSAGSPFATYLLSGLLGRSLDNTIAEDPDRALSLLISSAEAGFPPAQVDLAQRYETGDGVDGSYEEARLLYELASEANLGLATYKLGLFHHRGLGVEIDYARAAELYERAAAQGEPQGHTGLGQMAEFGEGTEQDYGRAAEHYQLAADRGEKVAQTALAYLYEQGMGVTQDYDKSFALLTDAAAQNWGFAQAALSIHYLFGQGTAIDLNKGFELAWSAQRSGVIYAEGILGYLYQQGLGTVRDLPAARLHFQNGAEGGDQYSADQLPIVDAGIACLDAAGAPYEPGVVPGVPFEAIDIDNAMAACQNAVALDPSIGNRVWLARVQLRAGDANAAIPVLEEGVTAGNILAHILLGERLLIGEGVDADPVRAIAMLEAIAKDYGIGQYALGAAYANGSGVPADRDQAMFWLRQAELFGISEATEKLLELGTSPKPDMIDLSGFGQEGPGY